jgi:DNA repair protein RadC
MTLSPIETVSAAIESLQDKGPVPQEYSTVPVYQLRVVKESVLKVPMFKVRDHERAGEVFRAYLQDRPSEFLAILLVDSQSNFLGIATVAIGTLSDVRSSVRDVLSHVIAGRAHAFIIGHNHPSSSLEASPQDIAFTEAIKSACDIMDMVLLDHIIVSSGITPGTMSFREHGLL